MSRPLIWSTFNQTSWATRCLVVATFVGLAAIINVFYIALVAGQFWNSGFLTMSFTIVISQFFAHPIKVFTDWVGTRFRIAWASFWRPRVERSHRSK